MSLSLNNTDETEYTSVSVYWTNICKYSSLWKWAVTIWTP